MATLRVLSARGDTAIQWDQRKAAAGDPEALAAIAEAERIFAEQRARGATAFRIAAGQNLKRLLRKRGWGRRPFPQGTPTVARSSPR